MSEGLRRKITTALIVCYIVFYFAFSGSDSARYFGLICVCFGALILSGIYVWTHRNDKSIIRAEIIADVLIVVFAVVIYIRYLKLL